LVLSQHGRLERLKSVVDGDLCQPIEQGSRNALSVKAIINGECRLGAFVR